jgi:hypothetical protein
MPKLCQIIAIEDGTRKNDYADLTKSHHTLQKTDLFSGHIATYAPLTEDPALKQPDQRKAIQQNAPEIVRLTQVALAEMWNVVATKDIGNCSAKADIVVDDAKLAAGVPVTNLLFLEKQLGDLRTFVSKLPVLDPSKEWEYDANKGTYVSKYPEQRIKTRKVHKSLVKIPPGPHTPGDAEIITVDEPEGTWTQIDMSTAYPRDVIRQMLDRISKLQAAVKSAREEANSIMVEKSSFAESLLSYIFDTK